MKAASVEKMRRRREDQFVYVVSSEGCRDVYPKNSPANFKILLKDPIEFPADEEWEVGLIDVHYPFSWFNVGAVPGTEMKFSADDKVFTVNFPNWQCGSLKEVVAFITAQVEAATMQYKVGIDKLGRFRMESKTLYCDVGFSASLRRVLGLTDYDPTLSYESMEQRAKHRIVLSRFWKGANPMDMLNVALYRQYWAELNAVELAQKLKDHLDVAKFQSVPEFEGHGDTDTGAVAQVLETENSDNFKTNFKVFKNHF